MSKSRGTFITAESYLQQGLNPEWLRYYYAAKLNSTMEDIDLNLEDFVARVNSDLVGKYVNIASRCAGFIAKQFDGKLSQTDKTLGELNRNLQALRGVAFLVQEAYDAREYGKAIREIMKAVDTSTSMSTECSPGFWQRMRPNANCCMRFARVRCFRSSPHDSADSDSPSHIPACGHGTFRDGPGFRLVGS